MEDTGAVPLAPGHTYVLAPLLVFGLIGVLVLVLRWSMQRGGSLVARPARPGQPHEYGLLVEVAAPHTEQDAETVAATLASHGIHATHTITVAGPRVFVWPRDEARAREVLHGLR